MPVTTDFSSLPLKLVEQQKLNSNKDALSAARLIYSYRLTNETCVIENESLKFLVQSQQHIRGKVNAGLASSISLHLADLNVLTAQQASNQCMARLELIRTLSKIKNIPLREESESFPPTYELLSLQDAKQKFSASTDNWKALEWPVTKLISLWNSKLSLNDLLSTQLILHTKLYTDTLDSFNQGRTTTAKLVSVQKMIADVERKLTQNRFELAMHFAEIKYLLDMPIESF
ncbi:hypothetical protein [Aliiglaciecola litoralis]